jgi:hypothetical protein
LGIVGMANLSVTKKLKKASETRKKTAEGFARAYGETHPDYERDFRSDAILIVQIVLGNTRRLVRDSQFMTLVGLIGLTATSVNLNSHPSDRFWQILGFVYLLLMLFNGFQLFKHTCDTDAYENELLAALTQRMNKRTAAFVEARAKVS